jgi:twitching motility protein PilT
VASLDTFNNLLETALKENASDLHITVGRAPTLRVGGVLIPLLKEAVVTPEFAEEFANILLTNDIARENFKKENEADFSYNFQDRARFRVNVFRQKGFAAAALRYIPTKIREFSELNLPQDTFHDILSRPQGFVLVVGPTGQGKTTTLAAMIQYLNQATTGNILTIEDPIEYLYTSDKAMINQREVGSDTHSSLHTNNASQTIDRIIDNFPAAQQTQVRAQLAGSLIAIISQRLIPRIQGGLIPAVEVMIVNSAVRNLIRENKIYEIDLVIETHAKEGMVSLNRALAMLVKKGEISLENALNFSGNANELKTLIK